MSATLPESPAPHASPASTRVDFRTLARRSPRTNRGTFDRAFAGVCIGIATFTVLILVTLLTQIGWTGFRWINWNFITGIPDSNPRMAGIGVAAMGTICICIVCGLVAIPLGIGTALLLEEFKPRNRHLARLLGFIQLNITNLAGVPSVVYGLLGLTAFVYMFGVFGTLQKPGLEFGAAVYDRYQTVANRTVLVPVTSREAAAEPLHSVKQFYDQNERPVKAEVVSASEFQPRVDAVNAKARGIVDETLKPFAGQTITDKKQLQAIADDIAKAMEVPVDAAAKDRLIDALRSALASTGFKARKERDRVAAGVGEVLLREQFPLTILDNAVPQDEVKERAWYFRLPFGRSVLTGGLTLMLVVLPIIIISTQEALRAVPRSLRMASLAMGATRWQTVRRATLPAALPGIMTGIILAMSRAIGEAAPVLMVAAGLFIANPPSNVMSGFTAMPLQIFDWVGRPQAEFRSLAAAGIILLLAVLICFNALAIYIRQRTQRAT
jgi:phosphate transport system permease protein